MANDLETIARISRLANVELPAAEQRTLAKEFAAILRFVDVLQGSALDEVAPTHHVSDVENVFRMDEVTSFSTPQIIVERASGSESDLIIGPTVFPPATRDHSAEQPWPAP